MTKTGARTIDPGESDIKSEKISNKRFFTIRLAKEKSSGWVIVGAAVTANCNGNNVPSSAYLLPACEFLFLNVFTSTGELPVPNYQK